MNPVHPAADLADEPSDGEADRDSTRSGQHEPDGRTSGGEGPGDGGADSHTVRHQRRGIVNQALALENGGRAIAGRRPSA